MNPYCEYVDQFDTGTADPMYAVNTKKAYDIILSDKKYLDEISR